MDNQFNNQTNSSENNYNNLSNRAETLSNSNTQGFANSSVMPSVSNVQAQSTSVVPQTPVVPEPQSQPSPVTPIVPEPQSQPTPVPPVVPEPQVKPTPVTPVVPEPQVQPTPVLPVVPEPQVQPTPVLPVVPEPQVQPAPVTPIVPEPQVQPATMTPAASNMQNGNVLAQSLNNFTPTNQNLNNGNVNNKKRLNILLIVAIVAVIAGIISIVVAISIKNGSAKNNTNSAKNEYEENNSNVSNKNTISYGGFDFEKMSKYQYEVIEGGLAVENNNVSMLIQAVQMDFASVDPQLEKETLEQDGFEVTDVQEKTINGTKMLAIQAKTSGKNFLVTIVEVKNDVLFVVFFINSENTNDYNNLTEIKEIVDSSTYTGSYFNYSKKFDFSKNLDDILK